MKTRTPLTTATQFRAKAYQYRSRAASARTGLLRSYYLRIAEGWEQRAQVVEKA